MSYTKIFDDIRKKVFYNVYILSGQEEYVKKEATEKLIDALVSTEFKDMNYQSLDGSEVGIDRIINACETLPFMAERRVIVVKDSILFTKAKTGENSNSSYDIKRMVEYIKDIPKTSHLIFYLRDSVDKRLSLYRAIKKYGSVIDFNSLDEYDLKRWIRKELKLEGKTITEPALEEFIGLSGKGLGHIKNEIEKLVSFANNTDVIEDDHILAIAIPTLEHSIFQLVEAIGNKATSVALEVLHEMLDRGEVFYSILPMIGRQIRLILFCKVYNKKGYTNSQIAKTLKIHPYGVGKYIAQGRNFTEAELKRALSDCLTLDYSIKQGKMDARVGLEMLIMSMCTLKKASYRKL